MPTYRPVMVADLTVPVSGSAQDRANFNDNSETIRFDVRVRKAVLESNDHNHADTLRLTVEWNDAGVDPRLLGNATVQFYLGDAGPNGTFVRDEKTLRFVGIATRIHREGKDDGGFVVDMEFHDYTALFLATKPYPTRGVPYMDMTLVQAWDHICNHTGVSNGDGSITSTVKALKDRLQFKGDLDGSQFVVGRAVAPRFRQLGKLQVKQGGDAWAVWQQCVGMCGLISFIRGDRCVVTTATDYYTQDNPPRLIWGKNILSWSETRKTAMVAKGVGITSFDPITGTTREALWPAPGDPHIMHKQLTAKKAGDPDQVRKASDYTYFSVPSITTDEALLDCAKRVYEERSRQELEGTLRTVEMFLPRSTTADSNGNERELATFDVIALSAGDVIRVELGDDLRELRGSKTYSNPSERKLLLMAKGYSAEAATIISRNLDDIARLDGTFFVRKVTTTCEYADDGGSFEIDISYVNRIKVTGDASAT